MNASFNGKINFNSNDVNNLLNPNFAFVGVHWRNEIKQDFVNKMPEFYNCGIWENGYGRDKDNLNTYIDLIKRGDILMVKRLNGKGQETMKVLAMGIVVGFPLLYNVERTMAYVAWTLPNLDLDIPLKLVGTMNKPVTLKIIESWISNTSEDANVRAYQELFRLANLATARFITQNMQPITHTLYQS